MKQNTLSRAETAQPLSINHKRGDQVAANKAAYTVTSHDTVVVSRGGKNAGAPPPLGARESSSRFNRFSCKIRRLDQSFLFSERVTYELLECLILT